MKRANYVSYQIHVLMYCLLVLFVIKLITIIPELKTCSWFTGVISYFNYINRFDAWQYQFLMLIIYLNSDRASVSATQILFLITLLCSHNNQIKLIHFIHHGLAINIENWDHILEACTPDYSVFISLDDVRRCCWALAILSIVWKSN